MAEYKREITLASVGAITVVVVLALAVMYLPVGLGGVSTTGPLPGRYSVLGQTPYLSVTPTNHTFVIPFNVTTSDYSINLTYSQADSYAWLYSNTTEWIFSGRACESNIPSAATMETSTITTMMTGTRVVTSNSTITAASQVPCGGGPYSPWYALNGTLISRDMQLSRSEVEMAIQPSSIPAHYSGKIRLTLTVQMPAGNYALFLAVHVAEPDYPNFDTAPLYILYYMPVVVNVNH